MARDRPKLSFIVIQPQQVEFKNIRIALTCRSKLFGDGTAVNPWLNAGRMPDPDTAISQS